MESLLETIHNVPILHNGTLELEYRLKGNDVVSIAKKLISKYSNGKISQSLNVISNGVIKTIHFVSGVKQQDDENLLIVKEKKIKPIIQDIGNGYTLAINLSTELISDLTKLPTHNPIMRIKVRYSVKVSENWQLDITLVYQSEFNKSVLDVKRAEMFKDTLPWTTCNNVEVELEFVGNYKKINEEDLAFAVKFFKDETANIVHNVINGGNEQYQSVLFDIASIIKPEQRNLFRYKYNAKKLGNQARELNKYVYLADVKPDILNFYITDKVDGFRAIIYIKSDIVYIVTDKLDSSCEKHDMTAIIDCELYGNDIYLIDVMMYNDEVLVNIPFEKRYEYFEKLQGIAIGARILKTKPFIKLNTDYVKQISEMLSGKNAYTTDGIIFTPANGLYHTMIVYKYKPLVTIDFLIKRCPINGIVPYIAEPGKTLYILMCGINLTSYRKLGMKLINGYDKLFPHIDTRKLQEYFPIQFEPSDNTYAHIYNGDADNLDGTIGEFHYSDGKWKLIKIRTDRHDGLAKGIDYGNKYSVAELAWVNYACPLVIGDESMSYFQVHDNTAFKASRNFNNYVKTKIYENFNSTTFVLDMASGKGQDFMRSVKAKFANLLCTDNDAIALIGLIMRKHEYANSRYTGGHEMSFGTKSLKATTSTQATQLNGMRVYTQCIDFLNNYNSNIQQINKCVPLTSYQLIICNFAFHYFMKSNKTITNVIKFINNYLQSGGRFIFTAFDGENMYDFLTAHSGEWTVDQYSIKANYYLSDKLQNYGQEISAILPFSNGEYYNEYLVNVTYLISEFAKYGMMLEVKQSFTEFYKQYEIDNTDDYSKMTDADKTFSGLYYYYCFYKR